MAPLAHIFGVRHFSPAGALHLRRFLDEVRPETVLIEGPSDATDQLVHLAHKKTRPPVAVLAFTKARPVRSIVYPMAAYSPEWVALRWALEKKRDVRFMDLPASAFLELHQLEEPEAPGDAPPKQKPEDHSQAYLDDPYELIAQLSGDPDHETWWERHFEHTIEIGAYRDAIFEFGRGLRELRKDPPAREKETLLREAYMRREIRAAVKDPSKAVAVCGAFHAPVLTDELPAMTDAELKALPKADTVLTLMPYSYPRLSSQSGYGAGNHAPAYFEALYEEAAAGRPERLRSRYFADIAARIRKGGLVRSSAEVIEAVRLAEGLASLNDSPSPVLRDLRDAAVTMLGHGERLPIERALTEVEIGTSIGTLPEGVSRTALQDDFHQLVKTLTLSEYMQDKEKEKRLDLRKKYYRKTELGAIADRLRSTFLHRLAVLDIGFGKLKQTEHDHGTHSAFETWVLRWQPECEIRLAEQSLHADSIETAAAFRLAQHLLEVKDAGEASTVLLSAVKCELADALAVALRRVQELGVDEGAFSAVAIACANLTDAVRYGSTRDVDPAPLRPVLSQLYLRSTLLVFDACICDDDAAKIVRGGMDRVQEVAFLGEEGLDAERWVAAVRRVAESDNRNPFLSGYAAALLIERGRMDDASIDREVSRRLSPGTEASVGVGWFEGLVQRNRAALFLRRALWACLESYVGDLDDESFRKALLYLRRAFSTFEQGEVRRVVSLLGEIWKGAGVQQLAGEVEKKLDADEVKKVTEDLEGLDLV